MSRRKCRAAKRRRKVAPQGGAAKVAPQASRRKCPRTDEIGRERKRADDTRSVADDLRMSEQRCSNQRTQIGSLEKRVDELLASQRLTAEQFAACEFEIFL